ncbi:HAD-IIIC family phosphatase [Deltaproteobacteria bacterium]|nr:HAD-IIIC family phosphatase [Deltaproteobacteria bacterium]
MHIGLAGTFTLNPLIPHLRNQLSQKNIDNVEFVIAPYNQLYQLCLNHSEVLDHKQLDTIVIFLRLEDLLEKHLVKALSNNDEIAALFGEIDRLLDAISSLRDSFSGTLIITTPPYPSLTTFDIHDLEQPTSGGQLFTSLLYRWIDGLNKIKRIEILDLHGLLQLSGYENSHDDRKWYLYKQPYTELFWTQISIQLTRIIAAQTISAKKCVVVDCDDTLWGGIVGEDGLAGIELGEDFPGNAFRDFQKYLHFLCSKGIFLAVASKNNPEDVLEVFDTHDSMVLRRDHVSVFQIHWESKVSSLCEIAKTLNISTDSLVFVDDNPKEIAEVEERLPEVTCLLVPEETAYLPRLLRKEGLFDISEITDEDRVRTQMMSSEYRRKKLRKTQSEEDFIKSLELQIEVLEAEPKHMGRVTQLINKTNQFNLTTIRRNQDEIETLAATADKKVFAMNVSDRFGNYGLVGVAIISQLNSAEWFIDTLLMSCRVLGRGIEPTFLTRLAEEAQKLGGEKLHGEYRETRRNALVKDLYKSHGFAYDNINSRWTINISDSVLLT